MIDGGQQHFCLTIQALDVLPDVVKGLGQSPGRHRWPGLPGRLPPVRWRRLASSRSQGRQSASCTHKQAQRRAALAGASGRRTLHHRITTCSGSAVLSTSMALMPPVSAISGTIGPSLAASARLMILATWVEPVNTTPATPGCRHQRSAHGFARAVHQLQGVGFGHTGGIISLHGSSATAGVCSAGLASTVLPVASAAATWPTKMASGKFHGLMQTQTPRAVSDSCVGLAGHAKGMAPGRPAWGMARAA
jgi:hypothetical protein